MRVGLVVPCYVYTFCPEVGIATIEPLERLGVEVEYSFEQTCCGQPMASSGCEEDSCATEAHFVRLFSAGRTPREGSHRSDSSFLASDLKTRTAQVMQIVV
jgi:hypothetical protein